MFEYVTPDYIRFIKQFLINRIYSNYVKIVYTTIGIDNRNLINEIKNESIWNEIFNKEYIILNYYLLLNRRLKHDTSNEFCVYKQETYQEYIYREIAPINEKKDLINFIRNMKDNKFNDNMVEKYYNSQEMIKMKNHLIYIVKLYVNKKILPNCFMTKDEEYQIEPFIDMTPYFEYMRDNKWLDYNDCIADEKINNYEKESIQIIGEMMF